MSKIKIIFGVLGVLCLIIVLISFIAIKPMQEYQDKARNSVHKSGARMALVQMSGHILIHQIHADTFENPDFTTFETVENEHYVVGVTSKGSNDDQGFWIGKQDLIEKAKELCPECQITKDGFKIIAYGEVDGKPHAMTLANGENEEITELEVK